MSPTEVMASPLADVRHGEGDHQAEPRSGPRLSARWEQRFQQLEAFKAEHGHCDVPQNHQADRSLAVWVNNVRRLAKQGKLSAERVARLEAIGFSWALRKRRFCRRDWDAMVAALTAFQERYGHCNVPHQWPKDRELAAWLHGVRCTRRSGSLDRRRTEQLDQLGVVWEPEQERWKEMLVALVAYKAEHGDTNVPGVWPAHPRLAKWVAALRLSRKRGTLAARRINQLDDLGFIWEARGEQRWETMYAALAEYRRVHGHCRVSSIDSAHRKLGNWVRTQRTRRRQNDLSEEQIHRLDDLGFTWELWREQWDTMLAALAEYKNTFGHCDVPQAWAENRKLGNWVVTQRMYFRKGKLDDLQIERLNGLGFQWASGAERRAKAEPTRRRAA